MYGHFAGQPSDPTKRGGGCTNEVAAWGESTVWYIWTFGVISAFDLPYFPMVIPLLIEYAHTYSIEQK